MGNWAWFIQAPGFGGPADQSRAKEFIDAVMKCLDCELLPPPSSHDPEGNERAKNARGQYLHDQASIGGLLSAGALRGLQIAVDIRQQMTNGAPKLSKAGNPTFNVTWKPVPGQTLDGIAAGRAHLDAIDGVAAPKAEPSMIFRPPAPSAPAPAPAAAPGAIGGLLAGLRKGQ